MEICKRCGRPRSATGHNSLKWGHAYEAAHVTKSYVVHDYYGCDTGCCGHSVIGLDEQGHEIFREFEFAHPWSSDTPEGRSSWARDLARTHLPDVAYDDHLSEVTTSC